VKNYSFLLFGFLFQEKGGGEEKGIGEGKGEGEREGERRSFYISRPVFSPAGLVRHF
jgi:hypothetical protein